MYKVTNIDNIHARHTYTTLVSEAHTYRMCGNHHLTTPAIAAVGEISTKVFCLFFLFNTKC